MFDVQGIRTGRRAPERRCRVDTIAIDLLEPGTGTLRPILAGGVHAAAYLAMGRRR